MKKTLLIITQVVDETDSNLGFFCRWLAECAKQAEEVYVIAVRVGVHHLPSNVTVLSLGKERSTTRLGRLFLFWKYCFTYGRKAGAVLAHMCPEYIVYGAWLLGFGKRKIGLWYLHKSVTWQLKLAEKCVDYIFTAHHDGVQLKSKKIVVTGHGIDIDLFAARSQTAVESSALRLLTVGRVTPSKDLLILVKIVKMLSEQLGEKVHLRIVGDAYLPADQSYKAELEEEIGERSLEGQIEWVGKIPYTELPAAYQAADVFVNAGRTGGVDKVVLEAMASRLPVVTSNEAFKNILPPECLFTNGAVVEAVEKIKKYREIDVERLYQIVVRDHALAATVKKIIDLLFV